MPVLFQDWITRTDLRRHPGRIYVFGDNVEQRGYGGQAKQMRGEPNALGVPVKWAPSWDESAFFLDSDLPVVQPRIDRALSAIEASLAQGLWVVFPLAGLGTERADLRERAPQIWVYLYTRLAQMGVVWLSKGT